MSETKGAGICEEVSDAEGGMVIEGEEGEAFCIDDDTDNVAVDKEEDTSGPVVVVDSPRVSERGRLAESAEELDGVYTMKSSQYVFGWVAFVFVITSW